MYSGFSQNKRGMLKSSVDFVEISVGEKEWREGRLIWRCSRGLAVVVVVENKAVKLDRGIGIPIRPCTSLCRYKRPYRHTADSTLVNLVELYMCRYSRY